MEKAKQISNSISQNCEPALPAQWKMCLVERFTEWLVLAEIFLTSTDYREGLKYKNDEGKTLRDKPGRVI